MATVLSQAEIDELLNALVSGEAEPEPEPQKDADNVRPYDFRMANKFPKEQIRTLNIVFQTFSQLFSNKLSGILRTTVECELLSVEEMSFNEFNNSLPIPVILAIMLAEPLEGNLMIEISPEAGYMIINRLLGGTSKNVDNSKQFTEIELALIDRVLRQSLYILEEAWEKVLVMKAQLERLETSSQFAQIVALNEAVVVITLDIKLGDESGLISVCMPHSSIEPIAKQLTTRLWYSSSPTQKKATPDQTERLEAQVIGTPVSLTAYFEDTPATVSDIVSLQVGDVIRLNQSIDMPVTVKVQHIPKFRGKVGTSGAHYAVQIAEIIEGEENHDDVSG